MEIVGAFAASLHDAEDGRAARRSAFERFEDEGDYQGNAVINYCDMRVPYTRIAEHKHFTPWEQHERTICFREYSDLAGPADTPYYPLRLAHDKDLLAQYMTLAEQERGVTFIGRLGTYRYLDMHVVIGESLDLAGFCLENPDTTRWPAFSKPPLERDTTAEGRGKAAA